MEMPNSQDTPAKLPGIALFVCLMLFPAVSFAAPPPGIPDGWSDGFVYANGIRIHYYHAMPAPGKPVIVMAHGASDNGLCWTTLTWRLQKSYDIYMVDARGHGLSDPATATDSSDAMVKDLVGFLQVMKLNKPILLGHSMGAATVMRLGADYPGLARAIIMLDPGLGRGGPRPAAAGPPPVSPAAAPVNSAPDHLSISMAADPQTLVAQNNYNFDDLVATCRRQTPKWDMVDCQYWALSKKQFHGSYVSGPRPAMGGGMQTSELLAKISVPALILKADAPADVRKANEEAAKVMQNGKLVHIDGAGHNLHHDQLNRTVQELNDFLLNL